MQASSSKDRRLRKRSEYLHVQQSGKAFYTKRFVIVVAPGCSRYGITVSKKVGAAVFRNRVKRWVRSYLREHAAWLPGHLDIVVIAKRTIANANYQDVSNDLSSLAKRWPAR